MLGHEDFAYIVYPGGISQVGDFFGGQAERARHHLAIAGHHIAVAGAVQLARLRGMGQGFDRFSQDVGIIAILFIAAVSPSVNSSAVETWSPPACLETYIPVSSFRVTASTEKPCTGKLPTP